MTIHEKIARGLRDHLKKNGWKCKFDRGTSWNGYWFPPDGGEHTGDNGDSIITLELKRRARPPREKEIEHAVVHITIDKVVICYGGGPEAMDMNDPSLLDWIDEYLCPEFEF